MKGGMVDKQEEGEGVCPHCGHLWSMHKVSPPSYDDYQCEQQISDTMGARCGCAKYEEDEQEELVMYAVCSCGHSSEVHSLSLKGRGACEFIMDGVECTCRKFTKGVKKA